MKDLLHQVKVLSCGQVWNKSHGHHVYLTAAVARTNKSRIGKGHMKEYMVNIGLPGDPPEEFVALIPRQRAQVNRLMQKGTITSYSLAYDRSRLWVTMRAESEEDVLKFVATFPLLRWMDIEVEQLMFRNIGAAVMPPVSMN